MKIGETLRIEYDDNIVDVVDRLNDALEEHGLKFEDDELPHDGFNVLTLKRVALPQPAREKAIKALDLYFNEAGIEAADLLDAILGATHEALKASP